MFHMVRFLGERFALDLVAPALEGREEAERLLGKVCNDMEFVSPSPGQLRRRVFRFGPYEKDPAFADAVCRRLATGSYAAVQVEKPALLPYLPPGLQIPIILDTWAYGLVGPLRALRYGSGILTRARTLLQLARFGLFDAFCWPETHCVLVVSEVDKTRWRRARPDRKVLVVPNGVDCAAVRPGPSSKDGPPVILFTGDMGFAPNVDAAMLLATRLFPEIRLRHPDAELCLVGRDPDPRIRKLVGAGIIVTGEVPDMAPHLHMATVYVAPHFTGAGTRTKIFEAMAAGLPIVTTSVGIEGIDAKHGQDVLLADDQPSLVEAVLRLLGDTAEREHLGTNARLLVEQKYDWPRCLAPLEALYVALLPQKATKVNAQDADRP